MRDGTVLRADVYRPDTKDRLPVILMRTQYGKSGAQAESRYQPPDWFASHCYLVVVQDVRGQGASGGTFSEFTHDMDDGYDSVEWAATLEGSNGKVGMYGSSYVGATQWLAAVSAPPHLVTIVPANTASDYYDGWTYQGGEFRLAFVQPWAIGSIALTAAQNRNDQATVAQLTAAAADPTRWMDFRPFKDLPPLQPQNPAVAPWYFDWIRHWRRDDFWRRFSIRDRYASVKVPALDVEGWYDAFLAGGIENFAGMAAHGATAEARDNQRLVIGPWDHVNWGRPASTPAPLLKDIGPVGDSPINDLMLAWFGHFLKGLDNGGLDNGVAGVAGVAGKPRVDYFVMGADVWKHAPSWPLPQTDWTTFYLSGAGGIADRKGQLVSAAPGTEPPDTYTYDPAFPAPSVGGHSCCGARSGPQGPYDQTPVEQRSDVLVYSSAPLAHDTEVTGPVSVRLWAQSTASDTDFTAKLTVVKPDGAVINLNNGILRTSFRDSLSDPKPTTPGQPAQYEIHVWPTSYEFRAGDVIRLEISSSDYPQFAPNPNTGAPFGQDSSIQTATQTILHDATHPSAMTLPIIPG
jgi:putative CocE/NonD family hydrolase